MVHDTTLSMLLEYVMVVVQKTAEKALHWLAVHWDQLLVLKIFQKAFDWMAVHLD